MSSGSPSSRKKSNVIDKAKAGIRKALSFQKPDSDEPASSSHRRQVIHLNDPDSYTNNDTQPTHPVRDGIQSLGPADNPIVDTQKSNEGHPWHPLQGQAPEKVVSKRAAAGNSPSQLSGDAESLYDDGEAYEARRKAMEEKGMRHQETPELTSVLGKYDWLELSDDEEPDPAETLDKVEHKENTNVGLQVGSADPVSRGRVSI
ncbi:hypothetical protein K440DRAFT_637215 [Wilcoxina mikolae CBS 423.85]|nr:hypothetical protein K440DRAFT_637215 [Wilcoxina mikolae CBS 423.85]